MAHFIGYLKGSRGPASRLGTKNTGVTARAQGWDVGGRVELSHEDGKDVVRFFVTGGSNACTNEFLALTIREGDVDAQG